MEILWLDFMQAVPMTFIECEDCLLGVEENKDILGIIKGFMRVHGIRPYDETTHKA